jgi:hypothetical protein
MVASKGARAGGVMVVLVWAAAVAAPLSSSGQPPGAAGPGDTLQATVRILPDTVVIGAPFRVLIRVRAPRGLTVQFPPGPDSGGAIEALDPRTVEAGRGDSVMSEVTATYRLAAWDLGQQSLVLGSLVTRGPSGASPIPLGDLSVFVASTLPASPAARRPRPARPLFADDNPWWKQWEVALAALAALATLWLILRHLRRTRRRPTVPVGPYAVAEREFANLDHLALLEAGERGRYVALLAEIVRTYLTRRLGHASLSETTTELVAELRADTRVPVERLCTLLIETDLVKFARAPVPIDRPRSLGTEARAVVAEIERGFDVAAAAIDAEAAAARTAAKVRRASGHAA